MTGRHNPSPTASEVVAVAEPVSREFPQQRVSEGCRRELVLVSELAAPARARAALRAFLASDRLPARKLFDLQLLVSELVSNAVRHGSRGGDSISILYERREGDHRVAVTNADDTDAVPVARPPSIRRLSGYGLRVVERLSDEWGADLRDGRYRVWFRARLGGSGALVSAEGQQAPT